MIKEAVKLIMEELLEGLENSLSTAEMADGGVEAAREAIKNLKHPLECELAEIWRVWEEQEVTPDDLIMDGDTVVLPFSTEGALGHWHIGNPQMWRGESWSEYPIRYTACVPHWEDVTQSKE